MEATTTQKPVVTLSSMHSAKGREFDRVIIIDTFDEIMPGEERDDALIYDPEEELRLFYVAVTRAAHPADKFITVCPTCHAALHRIRPWKSKHNCGEILR